MFTPWNPFSACLRAPREIHISDSAAYFTGVAKNDRIGEDSRNLLKPDGTIPRGLRKSKKRFFKKLHQRSVSGAFLCLFW